MQNGFEQEQQQAPTGQDHAEFYKRPKQNEEKTKLEGRPIFDLVEYVRIMVPGDKWNIVDRPARDEDRRRYAHLYRAFKADEAQQPSGTPLSAWGGLRPERVEEYTFRKARTVEQLADMTDSNLQDMGAGATAERQRARDYVEQAKGNAPIVKMRSELEERDKRIEVMEKALKEQGEQLAELKKQKK